MHAARTHARPHTTQTFAPRRPWQTSNGLGRHCDHVNAATAHEGDASRLRAPLVHGANAGKVQESSSYGIFPTVAFGSQERFHRKAIQSAIPQDFHGKLSKSSDLLITFLARKESARGRAVGARPELKQSESRPDPPYATTPSPSRVHHGTSAAARAPARPTGGGSEPRSGQAPAPQLGHRTTWS